MKLLHAPIFGLVVVAVAGCQQREPVVYRYDPQVLRHETFTAGSPYQIFADESPSRADSPAAPGGELAWWQLRNETWLNVRRNHPGGEWVAYRVITEDRQQSFGEHIHNVHRRRSQTVRESVFLR